MTQSLHLDLSWVTGLAGFDDAPVGFGVAGYHLYAPGAELAGLPVDAHRFGALLLFNMGG